VPGRAERTWDSDAARPPREHPAARGRAARAGDARPHADGWL